ncbi:hypothetical protein ACWJJH_08735 [Endozoicomonadaceae bacterium StTr2]
MSEQNDLLDGEELKTIIENQLEEGNPLKVKETLMRLMMTGTPKEEAIELMACALGLEMELMVNNEEAFNLTRYSETLDMLPETPWIDDVE